MFKVALINIFIFKCLKKKTKKNMCNVKAVISGEELIVLLPYYYFLSALQSVLVSVNQFWFPLMALISIISSSSSTVTVQPLCRTKLLVDKVRNYLVETVEGLKETKCVGFSGI